jgi:hypothetical protein
MNGEVRVGPRGAPQTRIPYGARGYTAEVYTRDESSAPLRLLEGMLVGNAAWEI